MPRRLILPAAAAAAGLAALVTGAGAPSAAATETAVRAPAPRERSAPGAGLETAYFAGGCFWGVEGVFSHVRGVRSATSGYAGGAAATASYSLVSTGRTGHAETVRVVFDPRQVNYADLLQVYFSVVADPTRLNAQGPDHGPQYRSALFPLSLTQERTARAYIAQLTAAHTFRAPIVTRLERDTGFYPAEGYHQRFLEKNPDHPYIVVNDLPKVEALRRLYPRLWRS